MSTSPEPPERLAEILLEILALSKPTGTSQSESARGTDPGELSDVHCVTEQSQPSDEEDNKRQTCSAGPRAGVRVELATATYL